MKATERKRLENKPRKDLVEIIDGLQVTITGMTTAWQEAGGGSMAAAVIPADPPFYWAIGYIGWGSWDTDVDFIDGGETCSTPQQAVDAWEDLRQQGTAQAYDQDNLGHPGQTLLVYRIDEIGRATTDRRWVFKAKS